MHGSSQSTHGLVKKARIEIIPLIDIMFFLLASFMLVSLSMINVKGHTVEIPTAETAQPNTKPDFTIVTIDAADNIWFEEQKVEKDDVLSRFQQLYNNNHNVRVFIRGEKKASCGTFTYILDKCRLAGIVKVSLEAKEPPENPAAAGK
jgi:biopolymer transport protein ExbD